jgi:hypothetical protein
MENVGRAVKRWPTAITCSIIASHLLQYVLAGGQKFEVNPSCNFAPEVILFYLLCVLERVKMDLEVQPAPSSPPSLQEHTKHVEKLTSGANLSGGKKKNAEGCFELGKSREFKYKSSHQKNTQRNTRYTIY